MCKLPVDVISQEVALFPITKHYVFTEKLHQEAEVEIWDEQRHMSRLDRV